MMAEGEWWRVNGDALDLAASVVGHVGVVCFLAAYLLLQKGTLKPDSYPYLLLNLAGALLLVLSLLWNWNLPAFLLEAIWGAISAYGLYKRATRHHPPATIHRSPP
jgi:hypothetical protein